jgi:hypothetical protein
MMQRSDTTSRCGAAPVNDHDLHVRIRAEYAEMPGLRLTIPQASRLFDVDVRRCERVLGGLVQIGSLSIAQGMFVRAGTGRLVL